MNSTERHHRHRNQEVRNKTQRSRRGFAATKSSSRLRLAKRVAAHRPQATSGKLSFVVARCFLPGIDEAHSILASTEPILLRCPPPITNHQSPITSHLSPLTRAALATLSTPSSQFLATPFRRLRPGLECSFPESQLRRNGPTAPYWCHEVTRRS